MALRRWRVLSPHTPNHLSSCLLRPSCSGRAAAAAPRAPHGLWMQAMSASSAASALPALPALPPRPRELVAVIGSTGTGKSQLAVELARHVRRLAQHPADAVPSGRAPYASAEVLSADSMQVYQGLDVVTNKVTPAEMGGVPHHLIDFLTPGQQYHLVQFCADCHHIEQQLRARPEPALPILAGGTTYYVQHALFPGLVVRSDVPDAPDEGAAAGAGPSAASPSHQQRGGNGRNGSFTDAPPAPVPAWLSDIVATLPEPEARLFHALRHDTSGILKRAMSAPKDQNYLKPPRASSNADAHVDMPPALDTRVELETAWRDEKILWRLLNAFDPTVAKRWHPTDKRKILNSLRVLMTTGRRHSDWIQEEHRHRIQAANSTTTLSAHDASDTSAPSPDARVLLFWVWRRPEELTSSLNARIGKMVHRGLLPQIQELRAIVRAQHLRQRCHSDSSSQHHPAAPSDYHSQTDLYDYDRGIFQSIGYKEFDPFLRYIEAHPSAAQWANQHLGPLSQEMAHITHGANAQKIDQREGSAPESRSPSHPHQPPTKDEIAQTQALFAHGIEAMQVATRQYAKKQVRWIRRVLSPEIRRAQKAFSPAGDPYSPPASSISGLPKVDLYLLDATDLEQWSTNVADPAKSLLEAWLHNDPLMSPYHLPLCQEAQAVVNEALTGQMIPSLPGRRRRSGSARRTLSGTPRQEPDGRQDASAAAKAFPDTTFENSIERNVLRKCPICSALPPYRDIIHHRSVGQFLLHLGDEGHISSDVVEEVRRELELREEEHEQEVRRLQGSDPADRAPQRIDTSPDELRQSDEMLARLIPADFRADVHVRVVDWELHSRSRAHRAATQFTSKDAHIRAQRLAGIKKAAGRKEEQRHQQKSLPLAERLEQLRLRRSHQGPAAGEGS